jgi:hypothetical protein
MAPALFRDNGLRILRRQDRDRAGVAGFDRLGANPATTWTSTVMIKRLALPASQPIGDGTIGLLIADRSLALRAPSRTGPCTRRGSAQIG